MSIAKGYTMVVACPACGGEVRIPGVMSPEGILTIRTLDDWSDLGVSALFSTTEMHIVHLACRVRFNERQQRERQEEEDGRDILSMFGPERNDTRFSKGDRIRAIGGPLTGTIVGLHDAHDPVLQSDVDLWDVVFDVPEDDERRHSVMAGTALTGLEENGT